jgi:RNA polymerase sigma factor, sigma-70 family
MSQKTDDFAAESPESLQQRTLDPRALSGQISRHYAGLLSLLRARLRDDDLAQEVLSQALLTAVEHYTAGRIADPTRIAGYVFHVAMNHSRNYRRKMDERVAKRADPDTVETIASEANENALDESQIKRKVREIMAELPTQRDRVLIKRFYLDEDEKEDICRDLGLSALHFDRVAFRARQRMRALLEAKGLRRSDFFSFLFLCCA